MSVISWYIEGPVKYKGIEGKFFVVQAVMGFSVERKVRVRSVASQFLREQIKKLVVEVVQINTGLAFSIKLIGRETK